MPSFVEATVVDILVERPGLQRVVIARDETGAHERAYVLTDVIGAVAVDDRVVVNTTAVDWKLGTGGWHVVHWNLSRRAWQHIGPGHIIKARYTSVQIDVGATEDQPEYSEPSSLDGMPVVVCLLHSQVAAVAAAIRHERPDARIAYLMTDQASLPIAISDLVHELKTKQLLDVTVTTGQAFGGDFESVNVMSGLGAAKCAADADVVIVSPGPGVVGTGTRLGFGGLEAVGVLDSAIRYGAEAVFALRWSDADQRERHRGLSHHSSTILDQCSREVRIPVPDDIELDLEGPTAERVAVPELDRLFAKHDLSVSSMGRSASEDPNLFRFAAAAGIVAARLLPDR